MRPLGRLSLSLILSLASGCKPARVPRFVEWRAPEVRRVVRVCLYVYLWARCQSQVEFVHTSQAFSRLPVWLAGRSLYSG